MAEETRTAMMQMRLLMFSLAATLAVASQTWAQPHNTTQPHAIQQTKWVKTHRVVIQVDQDDPKTMNLALNNHNSMQVTGAVCPAGGHSHRRSRFYQSCPIYQA
jgi:uncharacterized protein involved in copper resistance